jgi:protein subunit release factor B
MSTATNEELVAYTDIQDCKKNGDKSAAILVITSHALILVDKWKFVMKRVHLSNVKIMGMEPSNTSVLFYTDNKDHLWILSDKSDEIIKLVESVFFEGHKKYIPVANFDSTMSLRMQMDKHDSSLI